MTTLLFMEELSTVTENEKPEPASSGLSGTVGSIAPSNLSDPPIFLKRDRSMSQRFIKFIPSPEAEALWKVPFASLLLQVIATRARRLEGLPDGLEVGECYVGDHKTFGASRKQYRTALAYLVKLGQVQIIQNCRTKEGQKRAILGATKGTLVKLISSTIWDINAEDEGHVKGHQRATWGPSDPREADSSSPSPSPYIPPSLSSSPKNEKEGKRKQSSRKGGADAATVPGNDSISFNFETGTWTNITETDLASWKDLYRNIDVETELKRAAQWCLSNRANALKKRQWRRFLTQTWLQRNDEKAFNQAAYRGTSPNGSTIDPEENRRIAQRYEGKRSVGGTYIAECLSKGLEIRPTAGQGHVICVPYETPGFKAKLEQALRGARFEVS